jgi:serine/threonine protein kinase
MQNAITLPSSRPLGTVDEESSPGDSRNSHCGGGTGVRIAGKNEMEDLTDDTSDQHSSLHQSYPISPVIQTNLPPPEEEHEDTSPIRSELTMELTDANRVDRDIHRRSAALEPSAGSDHTLPTNDMVHPDNRATSTSNHPSAAHRYLHRDASLSVPDPAPAVSNRRGDSIWKPRGLTLSAYRRPEHTIRLTHSDPSRRLESEYDLHGAGASGVLGHGAFSTVRLARRRSDGLRVAVKSIAKHEALRSRRLRRVDRAGESSKKYYLEEWEILRRLQNHPYIVTLLDIFETEEEIQLVTEYCPGGELFDAIQRSQRGCRPKGSRWEQQAAHITSQILEALSSLHALGIVHRDVKPENILLARPLHQDDSVHVKLCDFGVARPLLPDEEDDEVPGTAACVLSDGEASPLTPGSRSRSFSTVGTDYYAAPELTYGNSYDTAVDIYSLGVTLYILLCGFPPVFGNAGAATLFFTQENDDDDDDDSDPDTYDEVLFPDAYWNDISVSAKSLLRRMLHPEPSLRISAAEAQQDPWIQTWVRSSTPQLISATPQQTPIDLNLVRHELYKSLIGSTQQQQQFELSLLPKRRHSTTAGPGPDLPLPKKPRGFGSPSFSRGQRAERRSSTTALMALADLYRGVTSPSVMAAARSVAAATQPESGSHSRVVENALPSSSDGTDLLESSPFVTAKSPVAALSF